DGAAGQGERGNDTFAGPPPQPSLASGGGSLTRAPPVDPVGREARQPERQDPPHRATLLSSIRSASGPGGRRGSAGAPPASAPAGAISPRPPAAGAKMTDGPHVQREKQGRR